MGLCPSTVKKGHIVWPLKTAVSLLCQSVFLKAMIEQGNEVANKISMADLMCV